MAKGTPRLRLLASTVARMLREDPWFFAVQSSRKLPSTARKPFALLGNKLPQSQAREMFRAMADLPSDSNSRGSIADDLRAIKGIKPSDDARVQAHARYLWAIGDIDGAIDVLPEGSSLRKRFESELRTLSGERLQFSPAVKTFGGAGSMVGTGWFAAANETPTSAGEGAGESSAAGAEGLDVLHVLVNSRPHTNSGYTVRTAAILEGQVKAGLKVAGVTRIAYPVTIGVLAPSDSDVVDGIEYHRLLPSSLPALPHDRLEKHAQMLSELVAQQNPKVLHATTNYANGLVAQAISHAHGIPWVYEMRGQLEKTWVARQTPENQDTASHSKRYKLMVERETELAKDANGVVVLSQIQKDDLIERGVDAEKIFVIPNAYTPPADLAARTPPEAREILGLAQQFTIGTITSIVDYEGLETLVDAVRIVRESGLDLQCLIVGDGVSRPGLEAKVAEVGLNDVIRFPGKVSPEESHTWYQALDLFAVPRKDTLVTRAVTPIKPIEAMSNGTPVISSDLPPLAELISTGGVTAPADDPQAWAHQIIELMQDRDTYETLSQAARQRASELTWDHNMKIYAELYRSLGVSVPER